MLAKDDCRGLDLPSVSVKGGVRLRNSSSGTPGILTVRAIKQQAELAPMKRTKEELLLRCSADQKSLEFHAAVAAPNSDTPISAQATPQHCTSVSAYMRVVETRRGEEKRSRQLPFQRKSPIGEARATGCGCSSQQHQHDERNGRNSDVNKNITNIHFVTLALCFIRYSLKDVCGGLTLGNDAQKPYSVSS